MKVTSCWTSSSWRPGKALSFCRAEGGSGLVVVQWEAFQEKRSPQKGLELQATAVRCFEEEVCCLRRSVRSSRLLGKPTWATSTQMIRGTACPPGVDEAIPLLVKALSGRFVASWLPGRLRQGRLPGCRGQG